jgi:hypothetical protein
MGYTESGIYVEGLNNIVAGLKGMGAEKELLALNLKVGEKVEKEAKIILNASITATNNKVPSTGKLEGSIKTLRSLKGVVVVAGKDPAIPYANAQNWGWFYDRDYLQAKNIPPKQFMNKAAAKVRKYVTEFYVKDLIAIYEKYSKKAGSISPSSYYSSTYSYETRR